MNPFWPESNPRERHVKACYIDAPIPIAVSRFQPEPDCSLGSSEWHYPAVYVAVLEDVEGRSLTKVGYSRWPENRIEELRYQVGAHLDLKQRVWLYAWFETKWAKEAEKAAHALLRKECALGEWFDCAPEKACSAISRAIRGLHR